MEANRGEFSSAWTAAEAATRDPFSLGRFVALVWENTSGYLLAACLVSMLAVLLSWVYVVRAGPPDGPRADQRTRTRRPADSTVKTSPSSKYDASAAGVPSTGRDDGPDDASDDVSDDAGPPPAGEEEDCDPSEDKPGGVPDLVDMAHHLPARVKQAELRHIRQKLQSDMTEEQRRKEREVELDQMSAILELMQQNSDKFGKPSLDDMQAQLKLYM